MKILIADDNPSLRRILRTLLETHGWLVCGAARNGAKAVAMARECKPDLVILDFVMPTMSGLYAARQISKILPGVPILLQSGCANSELDAEARKSGVTEVVFKADTRRLVQAIERIATATAHPADTQFRVAVADHSSEASAADQVAA